MIKIRIISAAVLDPEKAQRTLADIRPYQDPGVELSLNFNPIGPVMGMSETDHLYAMAGLPLKAIEAEKSGIDAIVIESMGDTAVDACREVVQIPVVGLGQTAIHTAAMLGNRFGFITAGHWQTVSLERLVRRYGLIDKFASSKSLDLIAFQNFHTEDAIKLIEQTALELLSKQGADTIIFGGSYFLDQAERLRKFLLGHRYMPLIIEALPLAIRFARALVECKLTQSKIIYPSPPMATRIIGYEHIEVEKTPGHRDALGRVENLRWFDSH